MQLDTTIQKIKDASLGGEMVAYVSAAIDGGLKKTTGGKHIGLCPFHSEKTPSFTVYEKKGEYKCWGCSASGDMISFVQKHEHLEFVEAVHKLAGHFSIALPKPTEGEEREAKIREALHTANERAAAVYAKALQNSKDGLAYVEKRGFTAADIKQWGIGSNHTVHLTAKLSESQENLLMAAGLAAKKEESGRVYDFFWSQERILFPVKDRLGKITAFSGRALKPTDTNPKYLNTRETSLWKKSENLYGIFEAKTAIRELAEAVVLEGATDVIAAHRSEVKNAVGFLGSNFTKEHIALLKQVCRDLKSVVLLRDNDENKSPEANAKNVRLNLASIGLILSAGLNPYIVEMPFGQDPDSFVRGNGDLLAYIKENRTDGIEYAVSELIAQSDGDKLAEISAKNKFIKEVIDLHPDKEQAAELALYVKDYGTKRQGKPKEAEGEVVQLQDFVSDILPDAEYFDRFGIEANTLSEFSVKGLSFYSYDQKGKRFERSAEKTPMVALEVAAGKNIYAYAPLEARHKFVQLQIDRTDNTFCFGREKLPNYTQYLFVWQELESCLRGWQELPQYGHVWLPEPDYLTVEFLASKTKNLVCFPSDNKRGKDFARIVGMKAIEMPLPKMPVSSLFPNKGESITDFWERDGSVEELLQVLVAQEEPNDEPVENAIIFEQDGMHIWRMKDHRLQKKQITNFKLSFLGRVEGEDNARIAQMENERGIAAQGMMPTDAFIDLKQFKRYCLNEKGGTFKPMHMDQTDLDAIMAQLLNDEKRIKKIERLGHNAEEDCYFVSNAIITTDGQIIEASELGIVQHQKNSYYLEYWSSLFRGKETNELLTSRGIIAKKSAVKFADWSKQHYKVYKENSPLYVLLAIASVYSTFIFEQNKGFPMLMIEGPTGTGKSAALDSILSIWGKAPKASFEKANTDAGINDIMGFYTDGMIGLEEINPEMKPVDMASLIGLFDRIKRYTKSYTKPIEGGFFMTGNYLPTELAPLMDRLILVYDKEKEFSLSDKLGFDALEDLERKGLTNVLAEIYALRKHFEGIFKPAHRQAYEDLTKLVKNESNRSASSNAILLAIYDCLKDRLAFPFTREAVIKACVTSIENVSKAVLTGGKNDFWEVISYLATREVSEDRRESIPHIEKGWHYRISNAKGHGQNLLFRFKDCYTQYAKYCREVGRKAQTEQEVIRRMEISSYWNGGKKMSYNFDTSLNGASFRQAAQCFVFDYDLYLEATKSSVHLEGIDLILDIKPEKEEDSEAPQAPKEQPTQPAQEPQRPVMPNPQGEVDFDEDKGMNPFF